MYEKIVLPNGVRLLTEAIPHMRSAALGIWVGSGSRHEPPRQQGISHFIEHMVFKGTAKRTAVEQAREMDLLGGQFNAYTAKEHTCYYTRVLDSHLPLATDLLFDLFYDAKFDAKDAALEKNVILEEIGMYQDTPDDLCVERLFAAAYRGNSLGRPILGQPSTLAQLTGRQLGSYRSARYLPGDTIVALAGRFTQADVEAVIAQCSRMEGAGTLSFPSAVYRPVVTVQKKEIEQNHLCLAFPSLLYGHPQRFALQLLTGILGGGMSSRIFQKIREELGLCYSINAFNSTHPDTALFCIYTALSRETETAAIQAICTLIQDVVEHGVTQEELDRVREQAKANLYLSTESVLTRLNRLAHAELVQEPLLSEEELLDAYRRITLEDLHAVARSIFDFRRVSLSVVGQAGSRAHYQTLLRPFQNQEVSAWSR